MCSAAAGAGSGPSSTPRSGTSRRTPTTCARRGAHHARGRADKGLKLIDRCAPDHPELAALWFGRGREFLVALRASAARAGPTGGKLDRDDGRLREARHFLERQAPGAAVRPELDAIIDRARAELRGPDTAAALARIASGASPDLAALLLAEALLEDGRSAALRRLYREELRDAARERAAALDTSRFTLLFAPGWLYRSRPENGAGFERQLALAAVMGIDADRIDTDENATVEHNARVIAEDLRRRAASGRRYVVVSASKSGPEVALALAMLSPEEGRHVAAWVNVAGVLGGSPREGMRSLGANDGLALTLDEIFPGTATLVELGLDHYMSAPDIDRRTVALTRAVRLVAERAAEDRRDEGDRLGWRR